MLFYTLSDIFYTVLKQESGVLDLYFYLHKIKKKYIKKIITDLCSWITHKSRESSCNNFPVFVSFGRPMERSKGFVFLLCWRVRKKEKRATGYSAIWAK